MGLPAALAFIEQYGGKQKVYVPENIPPGHEIEKTVGMEAARKLSSYYRGDYITNVPACKRALFDLRDKEICQRRSKGEDPAKFHNDYNISLRRTWQILARYNVKVNDPRQHRLEF